MSTWMRQLKPHADPMPEPPVLSAFRRYRVSSAPSGNDSRTRDLEHRADPTPRGALSCRAPVGPGPVEVVWRRCERHATRRVAVASGGFDGMTRACAPSRAGALGEPARASVQSVRKFEQ